MARLLDVQVADVMTGKPASVGVDATLEEAAGLMAEGGFRHLPVVDADRAVLGVLSERDLRERLGVELERFPEAPEDALAERVEGVMRSAPITIAATRPIRDLLAALADERIGAVPVVDGDERLVGIASLVDVVRWLRDREPAAAPVAPRRRRTRAKTKASRQRPRPYTW